jgi:hypothetical protein
MHVQRYAHVAQLGLRGISMWSVSGACCTAPFTLPALEDIQTMWQAVRNFTHVT